MMHVDCSWFYCVVLVVCRVGWVLPSCFLVGFFLFISGVFLLSVVWFFLAFVFVLSSVLCFFSFGVVCVCVPGFFCLLRVWMGVVLFFLVSSGCVLVDVLCCGVLLFWLLVGRSPSVLSCAWSCRDSVTTRPSTRQHG